MEEGFQVELRAARTHGFIDELIPAVAGFGLRALKGLRRLEGCELFSGAFGCRGTLWPTAW